MPIPRLFTAAAVLALVAAHAAPAARAQEPAPAPAAGPDAVVARVNGHELRRADVEAVAAELPEQYRQYPMQALYPMLLDQAIANELLAERAESADLASRPAVREQLDRARRAVLRNALVFDAIGKAATPDDLRRRYDAMKARPGFTYDEAKARHILVPGEQQAKDAIARLDKGEAFAEVAKSVSKDGSAQAGGDLGWFRRDAVVPAFADAAFALPKGAYTEAPVKSEFGWHVILLEDKRTTTPSFEQTEPEIRQEVARQAYTQLVQNLREGAEVERFKLDGSPMPEAPIVGGDAPAGPGANPAQPGAAPESD